MQGETYLGKSIGAMDAFNPLGTDIGVSLRPRSFHYCSVLDPME